MYNEYLDSPNYYGFAVANEAIDFKRVGQTIWQKILDIIEDIQSFAVKTFRQYKGTYQLEMPRELVGCCNAIHHVIVPQLQIAANTVQGSCRTDDKNTVDAGTAIVTMETLEQEFDENLARVEEKINDYEANKRNAFKSTTKYDYKTCLADIGVLNMLSKILKNSCLYLQHKAKKMEEVTGNLVRQFGNHVLSIATNARKIMRLYKKLVFSTNIKTVDMTRGLAKKSDRPYYLDESLDEGRMGGRVKPPIDVQYREVTESFLMFSDAEMIAMEADTKSWAYFTKSREIHKELKSTARLAKKYNKRLRKGIATVQDKEEMLDSCYDSIASLERFRGEVMQIPERTDLDNVLTVVTGVIKTVLIVMACISSIYLKIPGEGLKAERLNAAFKVLTSHNLSLRTVQLISVGSGTILGGTIAAFKHEPMNKKAGFATEDGDYTEHRVDSRKADLLNMLNAEISDLKALTQKIANIY